MKSKIASWDKSFYRSVSFISIVILLVGCIAFFGYAIANDETEIGVPCLVAAVVLFIIIQLKLNLAGHFYSVALMKGYRDTTYLKLAFFADIAGYLLIIALPDRSNQAVYVQSAPVRTAAPVNDLPEL